MTESTPQAHGPIISELVKEDAAFTDIVLTFVEGLGNRLREMEQAVRRSDFEGLRAAAHQLKGSGGGYGYPILTDRAARLEASAKAQALQECLDALMELKEIASETGTNLIWYSPTPYCELNPVNMGLGIKQCTACSLNMAIEPDGTVLPCQSYYEPLGNLLTDDWTDIWGHSLCERIRKREYVDGRCMDCGMLQLCGGGCPLSAVHGDYVCLDRHSSM